MKENIKKGDIIKIAVLAIIIIWIFLFFIDYFRARQEKTPLFCIHEETKEYDDGTVYSCTGLGYKMYKYDRASINASVEFGPFFIKERTEQFFFFVWCVIIIYVVMIMLNKHGWGLKEMLVLSGILVLFLIIAIYYIFTLYQELDRDVTDHYYTDLETELEDSAKVYIEDYYDGDLTSDGLTITRSVLRTYDLDVSLVDNRGRACSGYVIASRTHGEDFYQAYVSCPNYTTDDYEDWRS